MLTKIMCIIKRKQSDYFSTRKVISLHKWKDNSVLAKPLAACTHLSWTVSQLFEPQLQKNRHFHVPQPTFLFLLETPLRLSRNMLHGWKHNSMLVKRLAACTHLYSTVSQLFEPQVQKIAVFTYRSPHFCFPWKRPCGDHAICCTDGKTIQCLSNPRSMYLSIFNSFRVIRCLSQCVSPKIAIFTTFWFPLGTPLGQSH